MTKRNPFNKLYDAIFTYLVRKLKRVLRLADVTNINAHFPYCENCKLYMLNKTGICNECGAKLIKPKGA